MLQLAKSTDNATDHKIDMTMLAILVVLHLFRWLASSAA